MSHDPEQLLPFLKNPTAHYDMAEALAQCRSKMMIPEVAYLLERLGNNRQMILCLVDMGDIRTALSKVAERSCEPELWDLVVNYCISRLKYNLLLKQLLRFSPSWPYSPVGHSLIIIE